MCRWESVLHRVVALAAPLRREVLADFVHRCGGGRPALMRPQTTVGHEVSERRGEPLVTPSLRSASQTATRSHHSCRRSESSLCAALLGRRKF
jgi:hypothetical protein